jgi:hypothetical protein
MSPAAPQPSQYDNALLLKAKHFFYNRDHERTGLDACVLKVAQTVCEERGMTTAPLYDFLLRTNR